jgi:AraC-like DNA-binding protein
LHLLPTIIIVAIMMPILILPAEEKLRIMFDVGTLDRRPYLVYISTTKFVSLAIYGLMIILGYFRNRKTWRLTPAAQKWVRNLAIITGVYVFAYLVYAYEIINVVQSSRFFFNVQVLAMAFMVVYIGYTSQMQPNLFSKEFVIGKKKYKKSGLTPSFSSELKDQLMKFLEEDKVYRQNNISLEKVSEMLGTTRHNTSQVINEHFELNFFELINKYRIDEALEILKTDTARNLNIIDVAYEVGFNNKVTFNKSFRKLHDVTPTQYLKALNAS